MIGHSSAPASAYTSASASASASASGNTRRLPDGYTISAVGAKQQGAKQQGAKQQGAHSKARSGALRLAHAGVPLIAAPLPADEQGQGRVYEALVRAASARARMVELRSASIAAARDQDFTRERELAEEACRERTRYDVAIANALGRYS